jgi:hypothetical protein
MKFQNMDEAIENLDFTSGKMEVAQRKSTKDFKTEFALVTCVGKLVGGKTSEVLDLDPGS